MINWKIGDRLNVHGRTGEGTITAIFPGKVTATMDNGDVVSVTPGIGKQIPNSLQTRNFAVVVYHSDKDWRIQEGRVTTMTSKGLAGLLADLDREYGVREAYIDMACMCGNAYTHDDRFIRFRLTSD